MEHCYGKSNVVDMNNCNSGLQLDSRLGYHHRHTHKTMKRDGAEKMGPQI